MESALIRSNIKLLGLLKYFNSFVFRIKWDQATFFHVCFSPYHLAYFPKAKKKKLLHPTSLVGVKNLSQNKFAQTRKNIKSSPKHKQACPLHITSFFFT